MTTIVSIWSGVEARALREAKRMSVRTFAAHLGVSDRLVSKWEAGGRNICPRPVNQQALDTSLAASSTDVLMRFQATIGKTEAGSLSSTTAGSLAREESFADHQPVSIGQHQLRHPADGKLMTLVEGGRHVVGDANEEATTASFYIDVFPVTNAEYARYCALTRYRVPQHWNGRLVPPNSLGDHPVVFVDWNDAAAYARWTVKELPTSVQWEKAARGTEGDPYPWGTGLTPAKCNVRESGLRSTTSVTQFHSGVSPYGVYDMCGNVWEWCSSTPTAGRRELKGSAFTSPFARCTPSTFNDATETMMDDDTGFRCVASVETVSAMLRLGE